MERVYDLVVMVALLLMSVAMVTGQVWDDPSNAFNRNWRPDDMGVYRLCFRFVHSERVTANPRVKGSSPT